MCVVLCDTDSGRALVGLATEQWSSIQHARRDLQATRALRFCEGNLERAAAFAAEQLEADKV